MRLLLLIFVSFSFVLQLQGATSLLNGCLSLGNACKMEMPAGSSCGCQNTGNLPMLPDASGNCPYDCVKCNLEVNAAYILLSLPSISRTTEVDRALEGALKISVAEWLPDPLIPLSNAGIDASPPRRLMTEWGVWHL